MTFTGVNVQIVSGSGATDGPVNGTGNLIIGYNENPGDQSGSHNLVVGQGHTFTNYGGFVAGLGNTVGGPNASVSGGQGNTAYAGWSSISGGMSNVHARRAPSAVRGESPGSRAIRQATRWRVRAAV
jgi:hypothetical protein